MSLKLKLQAIQGQALGQQADTHIEDLKKDFEKYAVEVASRGGSSIQLVFSSTIDHALEAFTRYLVAEGFIFFHGTLYEDIIFTDQTIYFVSGMPPRIHEEKIIIKLPINALQVKVMW